MSSLALFVCSLQVHEQCFGEGLPIHADLPDRLAHALLLLHSGLQRFEGPGLDPAADLVFGQMFRSFEIKRQL